MCGSEVRHRSSTSTPPRSAISRPAARASASRGPDARREHDDLGGDGVRVLEAEPRRAPVALDHLGGHRARVHAEPKALDVPAQRGAAGVVHLHRHQPRGHLDDVRLQAELGQRVGGLEPEQAASDDRADRRGGRPPHGSPRGPRWSGRRSSRAARDREPAARTARRRWPAPARRTVRTRPSSSEHRLRLGVEAPRPRCRGRARPAGRRRRRPAAATARRRRPRRTR